MLPLLLLFRLSSLASLVRAWLKVCFAKLGCWCRGRNRRGLSGKALEVLPMFRTGSILFAALVTLPVLGLTSVWPATFKPPASSKRSPPQASATALAKNRRGSGGASAPVQKPAANQ